MYKRQILNIVKQDFNRIDRLPPYIFGEINKLKAKLRKNGKDIIDFGMGNPDMPTPKHIRDKLKEVTDKPGTGRYSMSKGVPGLRKAFLKPGTPLLIEYLPVPGLSVTSFNLSLICLGVGMSGLPMPKSIMSLPFFLSFALSLFISPNI